MIYENIQIGKLYYMTVYLRYTPTENGNIYYVQGAMEHDNLGNLYYGDIPSNNGKNPIALILRTHKDTNKIGGRKFFQVLMEKSIFYIHLTDIVRPAQP